MADEELTNADLPGSGLLGRPGAPGGRVKLTDAIITRIAQAVNGGAYIQEACEYGGISSASYYSYRRIGQEVLERIEADDAPDDVEATLSLMEALCLDFLRRVTAAERECEVRLVTQWNIAAKDDWRAAAAFLSRRFGDRWGEKSTIRQEISGPGGEPIEVQTRGDLARAMAENPEARHLASQLLAHVVPSFVPGMEQDAELALDEVGGGGREDDDMPDATAVEDYADVPGDWDEGDVEET